MKFALFCSALLLAQSALAQARPDAGAPPAGLTVELKDGQGKRVGQARLTQTPAGLLIAADLKGIPPGAHAFHLHEVGKCEGPTFKSAGGHYNPGGVQHGFQNPKGSHAGDLPNLFVPPSGELKVEVLNCGGVKLEKLQETGASLMVHASGDDYHSDPAGAAGDRIACGVIPKR